LVSCAEALSDSARPAEESSVPLTKARREMGLAIGSEAVVEVMGFMEE
jgi:hypothetical protein